MPTQIDLSLSEKTELGDTLLSRLKQLGRDSVVYGIGGVLARSVAFFTIPLFTRIFSPEEFGTIEMLIVLSSFLGAIMMMGMDSAQSMYFFKHKDQGKQEQTRIISAILQIRVLWGSLVVVAATLLSPILNTLLFQGELSWIYFGIAFSGALFAQIMSQSAEVMRLLYRPWGFVTITLCHSLLGAGLMIICIVFFDKGILGYFIGSIISSVLVALLGWHQIKEYFDASHLHFDWWPQIIKFGAPFVPAELAFFLMSSADRWFVKYYHGGTELGLYSVGAKFCILLSLVIMTFRQSFWPIALDAMHSSDGPATFRLIGRLYIGVCCAGVVLLTSISPFLIETLTGPDFHAAWPIVGILSWQAVFYGFFLISSAGIWKSEKTYLNLPLMAGAAGFGIILNWLLVPEFAGVGAAIATAITYLFWVFTSLIVSERLWKVGFPILIMVSQITISACYVYVFIFVLEGVSSLTLNLITLILVMMLVWFAIPSGHRHFNKTELVSKITRSLGDKKDV